MAGCDGPSPRPEFSNPRWQSWFGAPTRATKRTRGQHRCLSNDLGREASAKATRFKENRESAVTTKPTLSMGLAVEFLNTPICGYLASAPTVPENTFI
jgi:hypothetical protein